MLSDPALREALEWGSEDLKENTVANRLKNLISEEGKGSFQRVRREQMLDPASTWGQVMFVRHLMLMPETDWVLYRSYPVPERLNAVCNSCATVPRTGKKRKVID